MARKKAMTLPWVLLFGGLFIALFVAVMDLLWGRV